MANESKISIYGAILSNLLIAISKFIAASFTGSSAMLAEGIHSLVDTGDGFLLLLGIKRGKKKANRQHPFGFGKEEYFWSFVVSIMIFALGGGLAIFQGIYALRHPTALEDPLWNYIVIFAAIIFEGTSLFIAVKNFRKLKPSGGLFSNMVKSKNPPSFAIIIEDSAAVAGLLVALAGVYFSHLFQNPDLDAAASLGIGILLLLVATFLARETKGLLIGESAGKKTIDAVEDLLESWPKIVHWHYPKSMHMGPNSILMVIEVVFKENMDYQEVQKNILQLRNEIMNIDHSINQLSIQPIFIKEDIDSKEDKNG